MPKLDLVLQKLDNMEKKLDILEGFVKVVDGKVNKLQDKAEQFESFSRDATTKLKVLDEGMSFANTEIENLKKKVKLLEQTIQENTVNTENKFKGKIEALRNEKLYMEVYQRRENLRFYGIAESFHLSEENVKEVLIGFIQKELNISEADSFEYQRVHRIGKRDPSQEKPRPIIARFLRYSDRERVMSSARKLKGTGFGISPDLPKEIVDRRKELMPKFKKAKEDGKSAFFKRSEPDKLFIEGIRIF
ncbi:protein unc-13 homolog C-like [Orbicella faveolata]|nr:protein unc-13 homolog C-like [Orbicella faveolata]